MNDELDESNNTSDPNMRTKTHIWDLKDLNNPKYVGAYIHESRAIDHNLFIKGDFVYMSNYTSGLRIFDISRLAAIADLATITQADIQGAFVAAGYFDTYNQDDANPQTSFNGQWGNYPYFPSGTILAGDRNNGLFVLAFAAPEPGALSLMLLASLCGGRVWRRRRT